MVPCKVEDGHRVVCVVDLQAWEIEIYDPKAHWKPNSSSSICQQILPLRRLFPVICLKAGYFNRTGRVKYDLATMKARRVEATRVPKQIGKQNNAVFVMLMICSILRGKKSMKFSEMDIRSHREAIAYELFTNSLSEEC